MRLSARPVPSPSRKQSDRPRGAFGIDERRRSSRSAAGMRAGPAKVHIWGQLLQLRFASEGSLAASIAVFVTPSCITRAGETAHPSATRRVRSGSGRNNNLQGTQKHLHHIRRDATESNREWRISVAAGSRPACAATEAVAEQSPDREPAIGVANFLAFTRRAGRIRDRDFRDFLAHAAELRRYFRAKLEAAALQVNLREDGAAKNFVTSGFIVNASPVEKIG